MVRHTYIVYCSHCGDIYQRTQWLLKGEHVPVWRCVSRLLKRKNTINCPSRTVYEKDLHAAVVKAINKLIREGGSILPHFRENVEKALGETSSEEIMRIDAEMPEVQKEILKKANKREDCSDLEKRVDELRDEKQKLLLEDTTKESVRKQLETVEAFVKEQKEEITEFDEALVRKLISKITIHDDKMVFEFKSGMEIDAVVDVIGRHGNIRQVTIAAGYCGNCNIFFIMESAYDKLKMMGVPICRMTEEKVYLKGSTFMNGMKLAQESILMQYGYNVNQTEGLSSTQRKKILAVLIDNKILTKADIMSYLDTVI